MLHLQCLKNQVSDQTLRKEKKKRCIYIFEGERRRGCFLLAKKYIIQKLTHIQYKMRLKFKSHSLLLFQEGILISSSLLCFLVDLVFILEVLS